MTRAMSVLSLENWLLVGNIISHPWSATGRTAEQTVLAALEHDKGRAFAERKRALACTNRAGWSPLNLRGV